LKRKAPPPPSDQLIEYLTEYDLAVGELALALRLIMLEEAPMATETVFKNYALVLVYSLSGKWADAFCYISIHTRHVNLGFNWGAKLKDPDGLLIGSGKQFRHLKVNRPGDLEEPHLRTFIRAAMKHMQADRAKRPKNPPAVPERQRATSRSARTKGQPARK
jgi:hypothetical protein